MKKNDNKKTGNLGEGIAARFLVKQGFKIIDRNYLKKYGELDIIAKKGSKLYFIEVKSVSCETIQNVSSETGKNDSFRPEDNVHLWKQKRLARTIQVYLAEKKVSPETDWQFDIITVYIDKKQLISKVFVLENIIL